MESITFFVAGTAKPAGSKKAFYNAKVGRAMLTDMSENRAWRALVSDAAQQAYRGNPIAGPLRLDVIFQMKRPAGDILKSGGFSSNARPAPTTQPDATKLLRCLEDSLKGIIWIDDAQVVEQRVRKIYAPKIGALVTISRPEWCLRPTVEPAPGLFNFADESDHCAPSSRSGRLSASQGV